MEQRTRVVRLMSAYLASALITGLFLSRATERITRSVSFSLLVGQTSTSFIQRKRLIYRGKVKTGRELTLWAEEKMDLKIATKV